MAFYEFARAVVTVVLHMMYRVTFSGLEHIPSDSRRGFILCSNHISLVDPIFVGVKVKPRIYFMAKEELFHNRFFGALIRKLGAFPVDRNSGDMGAIHHAVNIVNDGCVLGIFPEGTRSRTGKMGRIMPGITLVAAQTGADILPCIIKKGKRRFLRKEITISYGEMIPFETLQIKGAEKKISALRYGTKIISDRMTALWEKV